MFGSMKKAMIATAVVVVGVFAAPAMASAEEWTLDGNPIVGSESVTAEGSLTLMWVGNSFRMTCSASLGISLGVGAAVQVTDANFADCDTNIPGCTFTLTATPAAPYPSTLPWTGAGILESGEKKVTIDDVYYTKQFGWGCPVAIRNVQLSEGGDLIPAFDAENQQLRFDGTGDTGTLTSGMGTAFVDGDLDVTAASLLDLTY